MASDILLLVQIILVEMHLNRGRHTLERDLLQLNTVLSCSQYVSGLVADA